MISFYFLTLWKSGLEKVWREISSLIITPLSVPSTSYLSSAFQWNIGEYMLCVSIVLHSRGVILYSTGNSIQNSVMTYRGKESKKK